MKIRLLVLFAALSASAYAGDRSTCNGNAPGEDIYKHYTGTIGDRKVMVDLRYGFCGASNYGGTYVYYSGTGKPHKLIIREPQSFAHNATLTATEMDADVYWPDVIHNEGLPKWTFVIGDNKLTGKCIVNGQESDINLVEDYSTATVLTLTVFNDSMKTMKPGKPMGSAYYSYIGIVPSTTLSAADARFLKEQLFSINRLDSKGTLDNIGTYASQSAFASFKTSYEQLPADTANVGWKMIKRVYASDMVMPMYNNNGIVVLEGTSFAMVNGKYESEYLYANLDMKTHKLWTVNNMIDSKTGKQKLLNLLQDAASKSAGKTSKETIQEKASSIPEDVAVTNSGLLFFSKNEETQSVFIPYAKLKGILSSDFAKRMNI